MYTKHRRECCIIWKTILFILSCSAFFFKCWEKKRRKDGRARAKKRLPPSSLYGVCVCVCVMVCSCAHISIRLAHIDLSMAISNERGKKKKKKKKKKGNSWCCSDPCIWCVSARNGLESFGWGAVSHTGLLMAVRELLFKKRTGETNVDIIGSDCICVPVQQIYIFFWYIVSPSTEKKKNK